MDATIDVSKLTAEQLRAALALKEGRVTSKCSFLPKRSDQVPCNETGDVQYGDFCYCKKHKRTVQSLNAKKRMEEENKVHVDEPATEVSDTSKPLPETATPVLLYPPPVAEPEKEEPIVQVKEVPKETVPVETKVDVNQPKKTKVSKKKTPEPKKEEPLIKKRVISPNKWGRFEDPETGIIFDPRSKAAYGVQDRNTGKVKALTPAHIKICEKYKWKYHVIKSTPPVVAVESSEDESTPEESLEEESGDDENEEEVEESGEEDEDEDEEDEEENEEEVEESGEEDDEEENDEEENEEEVEESGDEENEDDEDEEENEEEVEESGEEDEDEEENDYE